MFSYFQDPRYRQERILWVIVIPLMLLALAGVGILMVLKLRSFDKEKARPPLPPNPPAQASPESRPSNIRKEDKKEEPTPTPLPENPSEIIALAVIALQSGKLEDAQALIEKVDLDKAGSSLGWELSGLLKESAGDKKSAHDIYSRGIAATSAANLYYHRAVLNRESGAFEQAAEDFDQAAKRNTTDIVISNERLLFLIQIGRGRQASEEIEQLNARTKKAGTNGWIFAQCGLALTEGDYQRGGQFLASAKQVVDPRIFEQMLKNTVISSHMTQPEIMPFYIRNMGKQ